MANKSNILDGCKNLSTNSDIKNLLDLVIKDFQDEHIKLHEIVESLESSLTHPNPGERCIGVRFLGDFLHSIQSLQLRDKDISFLSAFMIDRLKDHHSVVPSVIYGILALVQQKHITNDDLTNILEALFREVHCQSLLIGDRKNFYSILQKSLFSKLDVAKTMGTSFVLGFIGMVDGEKDPRNLVYIFSFFPFMAKNIPLGPFAEDLFEVAAAYFPIEFTPPKNDKLGITTEDLIVGLRNCLSSSDEFAPYSLPFLIEKLSSDTVSAKLDALCTLEATCLSFSADSFAQQLIPLWTELKNQVIESFNKEVEEAALSTLSSIVSVIDKSPAVDVQEKLRTTADFAFRECSSLLYQPEQRLMAPSSDLLLAFTKPSKFLTRTIVPNVVKILNGIYHEQNTSRAKTVLMCVTAKFVHQGQNHNLFQAGEFDDLLDTFFTSLYEALISENTSLQEASLSQFTYCSDCFSSHQVHLYLARITQTLFDSPNESIRKGVVLCLNKCIKQNQLVDLVPFVQSMVDKLRVSVSHESIAAESNRWIMKSLSQLDLDSKSIALLFSELWDLRASQRTQKKWDGELVVTECLNEMLLKTDSKNIAFLQKELSSMDKVFEEALLLISKEKEVPVEILEQLSNISLTLSKSAENACLESFMNRLMESASETVSSESKFPVYAENYKFLVYPMIGLCLAWKNFFDNPMWSEYFRFLTKLFKATHEHSLATNFSQLIGSLLNRAPEEAVESVLHIIQQAMNDDVTPSQQVVLLMWTTKALIMRGSQDGPMYCNKLKDFLHSGPHGQMAAQSFASLLQDFPKYFNSSLGSKIRLLYKQQFLEQHLELYIQDFQGTSGQAKLNILLSVAHLLRFMPYSALVPHIQSILPVLLQCLSSDVGMVQTGGIETLEKFIVKFPENCSEHLPSLIPPLLTLSTSSSELNVRLSSLLCLCALTQLPAIKILPYKEEVVIGVKRALDDKKRIIRFAATNARSAWDVLGTLSDE